MRLLRGNSQNYRHSGRRVEAAGGFSRFSPRYRRAAGVGSSHHRTSDTASTGG